MPQQSNLHNELILASVNKEFSLHYQPQMNLSDGSFVGVEAFIRWNHPSRGLISAEHFIPLATKKGLIGAIGTWVIREACRQIARWETLFEKSVSIAVNVSVQQFNQTDLVAIIENATKEYKVNPKYLEIELTEAILVSESKHVKKTLNNLQGLGVKLSVDDVKNGYTSLWYLKQFRINKLKIDQSYILNMLDNTEAKARAYTIIRIAKSLRVISIAKGVEDERVLQLLSQHGCHESQGNLFSHPLSAQECTFFIQAHC